MSAKLLGDSAHPHTLLDDVESCVLVLVYASMLFMPTNFYHVDVLKVSVDIFDTVGTDGTGGKIKSGIYQTGEILTFSGGFQVPILFVDSVDYTFLIQCVLKLFYPRYLKKGDTVIPDEVHLSHLVGPLNNLLYNALARWEIIDLPDVFYKMNHLHQTTPSQDQLKHSDIKAYEALFKCEGTEVPTNWTRHPAKIFVLEDARGKPPPNLNVRRRSSRLQGTSKL